MRWPGTCPLPSTTPLAHPSLGVRPVQFSLDVHDNSELLRFHPVCNSPKSSSYLGNQKPGTLSISLSLSRSWWSCATSCKSAITVLRIFCPATPPLRPRPHPTPTPTPTPSPPPPRPHAHASTPTLTPSPHPHPTPTLTPRPHPLERLRPAHITDVTESLLQFFFSGYQERCSVFASSARAMASGMTRMRIKMNSCWKFILRSRWTHRGWVCCTYAVWCVCVFCLPEAFAHQKCIFR